METVLAFHKVMIDKVMSALVVSSFASLSFFLMDGPWDLKNSRVEQVEVHRGPIYCKIQAI